MSKRFKTQDYFRYKRLGIRWRKSSGRQSKLRLKKGGSGLRPSAGYGTEKSIKYLVSGLQPVVVSNASQIKDLNENHGIIISGAVGMKGRVAIYKAAQENGLKILNMKKVRKALKKDERIKKRQEEKEKSKKKKEKESEEEKKK